MKMIKILVGAVLAGGIVSSSAFASVEALSVWPQIARADKPTVTKVVNPTGLPQRVDGATINVAFTVDQNGAPQNIRLLSSSDRLLERSLIPALAQWRFAPVLKNGAPVSTPVVMPLKLVSGS
jgi:TonB family protein